MGEIRKSCVSGRFYPSSDVGCKKELTTFADPAGAADIQGTPRAGIVPHAGWTFSGLTAGKVFATIKKYSKPGTFILFGAVHRHMGDNPAVITAGEWETPLGNVLIDTEIAEAVIENLDVAIVPDTSPHEMEHSIEVQVPFIKHLFPGSKIVPILVPPSENASDLGASVGRTVSDNDEIVIIGSTDLTHYGPEYGFAPKGTGEDAHKWVKEVNDKKIIDMMCGMKYKEIVEEARQHHNACGSGAAAATVAAAAECGKKEGTLVEYITSHDVMPRGAPSMFVGYAGIVF